MQKELTLCRKAWINRFITILVLIFSGILTFKNNTADDLVSSPVGLNVFYYSLIWGNSLLNVFFPILPALLIEHRARTKTNIYKNAAISTLELITPIILFLVICSFGKDQSVNFVSGSIYSSVFSNHYLEPIWGYIVNILFFSFSLGLMSAALFKFNTYWHILIPLVIYNLVVYNPFAGLSPWVPMYCYDIVSLKKPILSHFTSFLLFLLFAILMCVFKNKSAKSQ